jgi:hypothetical protein
MSRARSAEARSTPCLARAVATDFANSSAVVSPRSSRAIALSLPSSLYACATISRTVPGSKPASSSKFRNDRATEDVSTPP